MISLKEPGDKKLAQTVFNNPLKHLIQQRLVTFDIREHDIAQKKSFVVYYLRITIQEGYGQSWQVPLRFNDFKDINKRVSIVQYFI